MNEQDAPEKVGKHFDTYTKQVSSIGRQITLSSIAIIWLFSDKVHAIIPEYFREILIFFILYLLLDFLQYLLGTIFSHVYEERSAFPSYVNLIINFFFYIKVLILILNCLYFIRGLLLVVTFK